MGGPGPVDTGFAAHAGLPMGHANTSQMVAEPARAVFPGGCTPRSDVLGTFLGWSLALPPRWGRVRVMGQILKGMHAPSKA